MTAAVEREDVARCRCTHEAGDTDCATHPICNNCGEDLGGTELKAKHDRLLARVLELQAGLMPASEMPEHIRQLAIVTIERDIARAEVERMRGILVVCHRGVNALWSAYHSGAWEMNHHEDENGRECPEDDTCECEGREAATLLSKASGMLTSWSRIEAAKDPE